MGKVFFIFALALVSCTIAHAGVSNVGIDRNIVPRAWCIANPQTSDNKLLIDIDTLCNYVDCALIRQGGSCYKPNTVADHASYLFNSFFRHRHSVPETCDFYGHALLVVNDPSSGSCIYP